MYSNELRCFHNRTSFAKKVLYLDNLIHQRTKTNSISLLVIFLFLKVTTIPSLFLNGKHASLKKSLFVKKLLSYVILYYVGIQIIIIKHVYIHAGPLALARKT